MLQIDFKVVLLEQEVRSKFVSNEVKLEVYTSPHRRVLVTDR